MGLFKRTNYKPVKNSGDFIFSDFSYGLYNLDTPRSLPEQLSSLALVGGRNVWTEKGALVSQYGYDTRAQFDTGDIPLAVSTDNSSANNIFVICNNDNIYHYTTLEGLKKYKTILSNVADPILAHSGSNLYIATEDDVYIFGDCYNEDPQDSLFQAIVQNVQITQQSSRILLPISESDLKYFWIDKRLVYIENGQTNYVSVTVDSITPKDEDDQGEYDYIVQLRYTDPNDLEIIEGTISVGEKALHELNYSDPPYTNDAHPEFCWVNEPSAITVEIPNGKIHPKLMAVALNRLWIVDINNIVFYSAVGNMASFEQANGAGYFYGFYNDTSEVLSIEEFYSGVLITKQTGMYHVTLATKDYTYTSGNSTIVAQGSTDNYLSVNKVNNITQKYPGDHVIIGSEVIAFDSSSGNLVQAAYVNYLNNIQEGSVLLHGSELDSQSLGLQSANNRVLAYSFQEEILLLYYGSKLDKALLITRGLSLFPREVNKEFLSIQMFSQGFINITTDGYVLEDFKRGTIVPDITPLADFEPIGLRGNNMLCGTIIEITELNGVRYRLGTSNAGDADQRIVPVIIQVTKDSALPNLVYSDKARNFLPASFADETRWASQKSSVTRIAAPLSGRDGLSSTVEFEANVAFCLVAIRFPDMSQGE